MKWDQAKEWGRVINLELEDDKVCEHACTACMREHEHFQPRDCRRRSTLPSEPILSRPTPTVLCKLIEIPMLYMLAKRGCFVAVLVLIQLRQLGTLLDVDDTHLKHRLKIHAWVFARARQQDLTQSVASKQLLPSLEAGASTMPAQETPAGTIFSPQLTQTPTWHARAPPTLQLHAPEEHGTIALIFCCLLGI